MLNQEKIGRQIALLRKEKGLTGERLAEMLNISAQAISKWERGKCLPETAILPKLAHVLECTVDTILNPRELVILEAIYTDGQQVVNVTQFVMNFVRDNMLHISVTPNFVGTTIDSDRLKVLTVKYSTPEGVSFTHAVQEEVLNIDTSAGQTNEKPFRLIGAYYGGQGGWSDAMKKMEHYEYFKWDRIHVNHESFPSNSASDETEYLLLVYLNKFGIHAISCAENDTLYYNADRTGLYLQDRTGYIMPGIERLEWGKGMECPWAGALYASLKYMGEDYTYEQIMGMSGACYRICFVDVWDFSCTDALVSYDFSRTLYPAIGYVPVWADRLEKGARKAERHAIIRDIREGKPVLAINLRVAPEWGVICGYLDDGNRFLCRTYFDDAVFREWDNDTGEREEERRLCREEWGGYLVNDFWPFLIVHFGNKVEKASACDTLIRSLETLKDVFYADNRDGYYNGKNAYEAWIRGLLKDDDFDMGREPDSVMRRLEVNDSMLFQLADARRCAESYLRQSAALLGQQSQQVVKIADHYHTIWRAVEDFRERLESCCGAGAVYNEFGVARIMTGKFREEQVQLLKRIIRLEEENVRLASEVLKA